MCILRPQAKLLKKIKTSKRLGDCFWEETKKACGKGERVGMENKPFLLKEDMWKWYTSLLKIHWQATSSYKAKQNEAGKRHSGGDHAHPYFSGGRGAS